jgi:hypothetical protein
MDKNNDILSLFERLTIKVTLLAKEDTEESLRRLVSLNNDREELRAKLLLMLNKSNIEESYFTNE